MNMDDSGNLSFFGNITASVTHEITNVLSIINELNGLLEDQIYNAGQHVPFDAEKLSKIKDKVEYQVQRGQGLIKKLNYFSHSVDSQYSEFDLIFLLKNLIVLSQRFASAKYLEIHEKFNVESHVIKSNPFITQLLFFQCFKYMFKVTKQKNIISIISGFDSKLFIEIISLEIDGIIDFEEEEIISIKNLAETLNVIADFKFTNNEFKIKIVL